jgi:type I restriction enzyme, S subunit
MKSKTKLQLDAWPTRKLKDIAEIRISNVDKKVYASEKPVKLCNYMDVYGNEYVTDRIQFMEGSATAAEIERFGLNSGDVIITKDSETPDDIGIPAVVLDQIMNLVCGYHLALIRPNAELLDPIYLAKQLSTSIVARYFSLLASGSTRYGLPVSAIEAVEIPTPPKPEQTKIAEILSTVDRAIEQTEALIAKQQRIKTGLMQDLLTRGIDEHGNLRSEKTHKFKDSPLGRIPVEWEVEKWSQVCSKIQDGTHFSPKTDSSAEFKYITSKNIKFGFLDLSDVEYIGQKPHNEIYKRCDVSFGDVLLTKDGANTGNAAINHLSEEFSLLSSVALIRPLESKLTSMFLLQTILSENGQRLIKDAMSGLAITRITLEIINNFLIKVPPIQEQQNMGQSLAVQDERIKSEAKILAKLRSLKTALMQDLLTGKKRVTHLLEAAEKPAA